MLRLSQKLGLVGKALLGGVVYADTFLPGPPTGPTGPSMSNRPLVLTSAVPLVMTWPAQGVGGLRVNHDPVTSHVS